MKKEDKDAFEKLTDATLIGEVTEESTLQMLHNGETIINTSIEKLENAWRGAIPCLLK